MLCNVYSTPPFRLVVVVALSSLPCRHLDTFLPHQLYLFQVLSCLRVVSLWRKFEQYQPEVCLFSGHNLIGNVPLSLCLCLCPSISTNIAQSSSQPYREPGERGPPPTPAIIRPRARPTKVETETIGKFYPSTVHSTAPH